ncbi:MAG: NAD(P) transhydrogenase subunit alpha [Firmicutes bacterium]|nr:NAD(P) transhydrogenase subunit alpha [Bacillota bacterium]
MHGALMQELFVFVLAVFLGFALITKIPSVLHTPLMSATNAIHGVVLVGAIVAAVLTRGPAQVALGVAAVFLGTLNVVGGYVVTDRMLEMFRKSPTGEAVRRG